MSLGSNLNASNIKEGDDVYFECSVRANPQPYKITWRHNGRELTHNVQKKVIISNQSLVLQKVTRADTGVYTCTAHNSEGDGVSNSINLNVKCTKKNLVTKISKVLRFFSSLIFQSNHFAKQDKPLCTELPKGKRFMLVAKLCRTPKTIYTSIGYLILLLRDWICKKI